MPVEVADTAVITLACRAAEATRPRPRYLDPHAGALFTALGLPTPLDPGDSVDVILARARLIDRALCRLDPGLLLNLGAGYDMRPSFLDALRAVPVVEIDTPAVLARKSAATATLPGARPVRRITADLSQPPDLNLGDLPTGGVIMTEGVLQYLDAQTVRRLATDLARDGRFDHWLTDTVSPGSLSWLGGRLAAANNAPSQPDLLPPHDLFAVLESAGWTAVRVDPIVPELRAMGSDSGLARAASGSPRDAVALFRRSAGLAE